MNDNLPPVVPDLPADQYHAMHGVGSSFLKEFMRSPAHAYAKYLDPDREPTDKKAFRIGRAWHCAIFEPHKFSAGYCVDHDVNKNTTRAKLLAVVLDNPAELARLVSIPDALKPTTKEGKVIWAEQEAAGMVPVSESDFAWIAVEAERMVGKDVLSAEKLADVQAAAAVARGWPISRVVFDQLAEHGAAEHSLFWAGHPSGVLLKIRPDYMIRPCPMFPHGLIIDGKSAKDAGSDAFGRAVWNYDYGLQAYLYTTVFQQVFRTQERPAFVWLAQEMEKPYAGRYYGAGADLINHYGPIVDGLIERVGQCQRSGIWPGYPETVEQLELPAYAQKRVDEAAAA